MPCIRKHLIVSFQTPRISSDDLERREKRALERKLSEMEEELKVCYVSFQKSGVCSATTTDLDYLLLLNLADPIKTKKEITSFSVGLKLILVVIWQ